MKIASPKPWAAFLLFMLAWGCSPENDNDPRCVAKDCEASCVEAGLLGGTCKGEDRCVCTPAAQEPYQWLEQSPVGDAGQDADTPHDSDSHGDSDTVLQTDVDGGPTDGDRDGG